MGTTNPFPVPAAYQQMLTALYQKLGNSLANLDYQDQSARRNYQQQLTQSRLGRVKDSGNLDITMGDRGLTQSGMNIQQHALLNQNYDKQNAAYANTLNSSIAKSARQRLADAAQYKVDKASLLQKAADAQAQAATNAKIAGV